MTRYTRRLLLTALALATAAGCKSAHKRCDTCPPPPPPGAPIIAPGPGGTIQPGAPIFTPGPSGSVGVPPGGTILPPASPPPGAPAAPAPNFPGGPASGYPPVASFYGSPGIRLGVPDSVIESTPQPPDAAPKAPAASQSPAAPQSPGNSRSPGVRLLAPEFGSGTAAAPATPPATPPAATPALPVGIVDFVPAIPDRVAVGRKPALEGLEWLKANGYKAALQLRRPGESDAADRKQVEARGLKFQSLEVSPATLSWATVDAFSKLVGDSATQPLFVYDTDGTLSGGLWYLYFRRVEKLSDEAARLRAARLGLKESGDGPQKEMWLAVQKLLAGGG